MQLGDFYISKKQIIIFLVILIGLSVTVYLVQTRQIFQSRAAILNRSFQVIQNTEAKQVANCNDSTCVTTTLDVIIKPISLENEPQSPIAAKITAPTSSGSKIDSSLGYYIPFRDSSVRVADPEAAKRRILNSWPNAQIGSWDTVVSQSISNGWNSAFVITLWMEESGAQGYSGYSDALGCDVNHPTTDINKSLNCLFSNFGSLNNNQFNDLMCIYGGDGFHRAPCTFNSANPNFPGDVARIYSELVPSGNGAIQR